jgi:N-methylhydantoinase A
VGVVKILGVLEADQRAITTISHGTTVATNQLLEGRIATLGFITTDGYQFVLEIARQSVPDGYGNSYFWVKPDRIVPPDLVRTVRGRLDYTGIELEPFDDAYRPSPPLASSPSAASTRLVSASCTPMPTVA